MGIITYGRRTGRTTRMCEDIALELEADHDVYVVVANNREAKRVKQIIAEIGGDHASPNLHLVPADSRNIIWDGLGLRGVRDNIFFDHYALEVHYHDVIAAWSRYLLDLADDTDKKESE